MGLDALINREGEQERRQTKDRKGKPLAPGTKVKVIAGDAKTEGTVVRVLDDYDVLTVLVPEGRGQAERMFRTNEVEAV